MQVPGTPGQDAAAEIKTERCLGVGKEDSGQSFLYFHILHFPVALPRPLEHCLEGPGNVFPDLSEQTPDLQSTRSKA